MHPCPLSFRAHLHLVQQQVVGMEAKVQQIVEMGFQREHAVVALRTAAGDENQAMEILLGSA
jgi:uncharacterized UBP type Zn finger protein